MMAARQTEGQMWAIKKAGDITPALFKTSAKSGGFRSGLVGQVAARLRLGLRQFADLCHDRLAHSAQRCRQFGRRGGQQESVDASFVLYRAHTMGRGFNLDVFLRRDAVERS